jgi:phage anti-repressor protein
MSLDIVSLIDGNPITRLSIQYRSKLINKIKHFFTSDEQQLFVASFYCYLNCPTSEFVIDLDNIWEWLGYKQKNNAKVIIEKHFELDVDYKKAPLFLQKPFEGNGGNNKEQYLLTTKTFKKLCMRANTKKSNDIHEYYIKLEEILIECVDEEGMELRQQLHNQKNILDETEKEGVELRQQLDNQKNIIDETEKALKFERKKQQIFNRKRFYDAEMGDTVYLYKNDAKDSGTLIKLGKTGNTRERETEYNAYNKNGEMVYCKRCHDCDLMERVCHHMLDKYRVKRDSEWFNVSIEVAMQVVDIAYMILDGLIPYVELLDSCEISEKVALCLEQLKSKSDEPEKIPIIEDKYENPYVEINDIIAQKRAEPIEVPELTYKSPLDFNKFIQEMCEEDPSFVCLKVDIYGAHKLWCRCSEKGTKDTMYKYFADKYDSGKKFYSEFNATLAVFKGIRPKPFTFSPKQIDAPSDIETFIMERCKVGYTYRTSYKSILDEFTDWKMQTMSEFSMDVTTKSNIYNYVNETFFPTCVYLKCAAVVESKLSNNAHGVWGLTLSNDNTNAGIKISHNLKKKVVQIDVITKEILDTWESVSSAGVALNMQASQVSTDIRFKRVRNGRVLAFGK